MSADDKTESLPFADRLLFFGIIGLACLEGLVIAAFLVRGVVKVVFG